MWEKTEKNVWAKNKWKVKVLSGSLDVREFSFFNEQESIAGKTPKFGPESGTHLRYKLDGRTGR